MNKNKSTEEKINKALDKVRPALQMDGGDIELVSWNKKSGIVKVKMLGMCSGCPMAQMTLKGMVEKEVKKEAKEVKSVESA